jgi:hypothetical protein
MKKALSIVAWLCIACTATAQNTTTFIEASSKIIKEKRAVANFDKVKINGPFKVVLGTSDKFIIVEGSNNIVPLISTEIKNGLLTVSLKDDLTIKPSKYNMIIVKIPSDVLNEISLYGSGSIKSNKKIANKMSIKLDGCGDISLNLYSPKTDASLLGSGTILLAGYSKTFNCKVTGSGTIKALQLDSDEVNATVMGSGAVTVLSNESITGRINGSGTIAFSGEPKGQDLQRTGTGKFVAP